MQKYEVTVEEIADPDSWYSHGIVVNNMVYISGQGPFTASGERVAGSFREQCRQAFANVAAVAKAAGGSLQGAVRVGVYLRDMNDFGDMNEVYREFFIDPFPARTTIQSDLSEVDIEVDAVVALD